MKRIIAAALSILVGAFGYTIVDSAIEDRVATLESEVVELREEVSRYHPNYSSQTTTRKTTTTTSLPTSTINDSYWQPTDVGSFLEEHSNSMHKFLLRKWSDGRIQYISPSRYENTTTSIATIYAYAFSATTTGAPIQITTTAAPTTTELTSKDYFLYVTEITAQLTDILEDVSYSHYYNNDYSMVSTIYTKIRYPIIVKCNGYTDPSFAGKQIVLSVSWIGNRNPDSIIKNTIKDDGSFEYEAIYSSTRRMYNYDASYSLSSISVS